MEQIRKEKVFSERSSIIGNFNHFIIQFLWKSSGLLNILVIRNRKLEYLEVLVKIFLERNISPNDQVLLFCSFGFSVNLFFQFKIICLIDFINIAEILLWNNHYLLNSDFNHKTKSKMPY